MKCVEHGRYNATLLGKKTKAQFKHFFQSMLNLRPINYLAHIEKRKIQSALWRYLNILAHLSWKPKTSLCLGDRCMLNALIKGEIIKNYLENLVIFYKYLLTHHLARKTQIMLIQICSNRDPRGRYYVYKHKQKLCNKVN